MIRNELLKYFEYLPINAQQYFIYFIEFIESRYQMKISSQPQNTPEN